MQKDVSNSLSELQPAISLRLILCSPSSAQLGVVFHDGTPRGISASATLVLSSACVSLDISAFS